LQCDSAVVKYVAIYGRTKAFKGANVQSCCDESFSTTIDVLLSDN